MSVFKDNPHPMHHTKQSLNKVVEQVLSAKEKLDAKAEEIKPFEPVAEKGWWVRNENMISCDKPEETSEKAVESTREEGSSMMDKVEKLAEKESKGDKKKKRVGQISLDLSGWKKSHQRRILTFLVPLFSGEAWEATVITEEDSFGPIMVKNSLGEEEEECPSTSEDEGSTDSEFQGVIIRRDQSPSSPPPGELRTMWGPPKEKQQKKKKEMRKEEEKKVIQKPEEESLYLEGGEKEEKLKKELFRTWIGTAENGKTVHFYESMLRKIYRPVPLTIYGRSMGDVIIWLVQSSKYADQIPEMKPSSIRLGSR